MLISRFFAVFVSGDSRVLFLAVRAKGGGGRGRERRAVVWPVSWLVRGRTWPGGLTLAGQAAVAKDARGGGLPGGGRCPFPVLPRVMIMCGRVAKAPARQGGGLHLPTGSGQGDTVPVRPAGALAGRREPVSSGSVLSPRPVLSSPQAGAAGDPHLSAVIAHGDHDGDRPRLCHPDGRDHRLPLPLPLPPGTPKRSGVMPSAAQ